MINNDTRAKQKISGLENFVSRYFINYLYLTNEKFPDLEFGG